MSLFIQRRTDAEPGSMAIAGIERIVHINVVCRDLEQSLQFYVDITASPAASTIPTGRYLNCTFHTPRPAHRN